MAFDLVVAAILLFTTIRGAAKGVAWQLAGIGALVLCFLFATPLSLTIAPMIKLNPPLNRWVAMLGIYLVFSFGTFAIARGFREALEKAKFVEFDRHLGALFGLAKGAIFVLTATFFAVAMSQQARDYVLTTYTGYSAAHIMDALHPVMPEQLHAILEPYIHELDAVDPDLGRRHDDELTEMEDGDADPIAGPDSRPTAGYRPTRGKGSEVGGASPDPFQEEAGDSQSPTEFNEQTAPTLADEAQQFLESLPALAKKIAPTIRQQLLKAFENTSAEHREEFAEELRKAPSAEHIGQVARSWQKGRPKRVTRPAVAPKSDPPLSFDLFNQGTTKRPEPRIPSRSNRPTAVPDEPESEEPDEDLQPRRQELLKGVARVFTSQPAQQAKKMTEVETLMLGLPDQVAVGVLEDWLSDLQGDDPDPDPQTDVTSDLNERIARQVDLRQIPRNRLPQEWQTKLESYLRN